MDSTDQPAQKAKHRNIVIIVVLVIVVAAGGLATWFALSRPAGVQRTDVQRLDKERQIVDNSMNLYDPLLQDFTAEYTNVVSESSENPEGSDNEEQDQVLNRQSEVLRREAKANSGRLETMASSPAAQDPEISDAFGHFKESYQAVIAYNDQRLINTANITRSVGGPCAPLHTELNVGSETYAQDYVKTADACLGSLGGAKDKADKETVELLSGIEAVIRGQRDRQQEVLDAKDDIERLSKRTLAAIAMLDLNDALAKVRTTYEEATKSKSTRLVDDANSSNAELERVLKARLDRFETAGKEGK